MQETGAAKSWFHMSFACAWTNKDPVAVGVDDIQGGQGLQAFHSFSLRQ